MATSKTIMEHAIKTLKQELDRLNTPIDEETEDDLIGAVLNIRQTSDIKLAIKILKEFIDKNNPQP